MAKLTPYEIEREKRIANNRLLLQDLGLEDGSKGILLTRPKPPLKPKKKVEPKKRKHEVVSENRDNDSEDEEGDRKPRKTSCAVNRDVAGHSESAVPLRRSARNSGKTMDYGIVEQDRSTRSYRVSTHAHDAMESEPRELNKRTQNPKQYGGIPGVEVGSWWETRQACSTDAIHAPWVGGISCGPKGAYSVALSGGYDDDVDLGVAFTYTGSGGRDLKGTKDKPKNLRTAPQSSDQTFENHFNKALKISSENGNPIRVIRGFKLRSPYAPAEGYRYDGLYSVKKAWQEVGLNSKYLVCKYAFKRIPGQPPLSIRDLEDEAREKEANETNDEVEDSEVDDDEKTQVVSTQKTGYSTTHVGDDGENEDEA
ncbi:hypothetical protein EW145_g3749 [Phellinidium pouzarii]|uniref:YDG domain-containing protein n=1 Tax=Phellinidium pouzarii TaxID=167371 RepID=A0A4S4L606_9AGAM|nr:hypothetical protein EW145_g3749 [Phellinidium pouzarii]